MRRNGFTILELLLTLLLISAVAAVAIPTYFNRSEVTLENAAILLVRDMRAAQNRAAFLGETTVVVILADGDGYRVTDLEGRPVGHPRSELTFERRYSADGVFRGVRIGKIELGSGRRIVFDPEGRVSEPGELTLVFGDDTRTIRIDHPSGRLTILGSTSGWVDLGY